MSKDEYLITDAPLKALTVFAMPMILGSFFQQIYNMADSIIVGQFVGSSALAAVGACAALTNVFICVALGAGVGAGVLVSRYFGAREYGKMKTIVSTSLFSFLILSIVLGVFGFCFSYSMMRVLQTPGDISRITGHNITYDLIHRIIAFFFHCVVNQVQDFFYFKLLIWFCSEILCTSQIIFCHFSHVLTIISFLF